MKSNVEDATMGSRGKAPETRTGKHLWQKHTKARFANKERKWALNVRKVDNLNHRGAEEKRDKLNLEFRTMPKDEFVNKIVKERMEVYHSTVDQRLTRI
ncbi:hypothetical protein GOP47_0002675 [Adiantum capillus-veneris]|uniref:Uncharacterized protein n=1 Tax=Adiantum capillus-veneris TaxID=13818 RepID=A0A9D4VCI7_ADICA|nr:hypothetical protein GOP47_0002675 [Adiantum capillus-veneris]